MLANNAGAGASSMPAMIFIRPRPRRSSVSCTRRRAGLEASCQGNCEHIMLAHLGAAALREQAGSLPLCFHQAHSFFIEGDEGVGTKPVSLIGDYAVGEVAACIQHG